ncbi:hypothetical protein ACP70R_043066 [Stipagrostis hirtigluma subsp. patula]
MSSMSGGSTGLKRCHASSSASLHASPDMKKDFKTYSTRQSNKLFISVVKKLSADQKNDIIRAGFGDVLELCCTFTPKVLVCWIISHFDATSNFFTFSNGASFSINAIAVHQILGLPIGGRKIDCKSTVDASLFFKQETKCAADTPTIKELVSLITPELSGASFVRIFLLFTFATFLCPTTHRQASPRYFPPLLNVDEISSYDWSLFVSDWLLDYTKRYLHKLAEGKSSALGGCTFLLVVLYLEFLKTPKDVLGHGFPRLKFWSSDVVTYVLNLDCFHGCPPSFGRLPVKDFYGSHVQKDQPSFEKLNEDEFFNTSELRESTRRKINNLSDKFIKSVFETIRPVISAYATDYIRILKEDQFHSSVSKQPVFQISPLVCANYFNTDGENSDLPFDNFSESDDDDLVSLKKFSHSQTFVNVQSDQLEHNKKKDQSVQTDSLLPVISQFFTPVIDDSLSQDSIVLEPFLHILSRMQSLSVSQPSLDLNLSYPFQCFEEYMMNFVQPIKVAASLPEETGPLETITSLFTEDSLSIVQSSPEKHFDTSFLDQSAAISHVISPSSSDKPMSLNERFKSTHSNINMAVVPTGTCFVDPHSSFDLITADCDMCVSSEANPNVLSNLNVDAFEIDPSLAQAYVECAIAVENQYEERRLQQVNCGFVNSRSLLDQQYDDKSVVHAKSSAKVPSIPIVFATEAEKSLFDKITCTVLKDAPSEHIFQIDNTWVDRRTLALSMRPGGWLNKFVMDAFCKMFNSEQEHRFKFGDNNAAQIANYFFLRKTVDLLMNPMLIHNDYCDEFRLHKLGIILDKVDYVYIPCSLNNQWFLIVANFLNKSFDVLSPEYGSGSCHKLINTIIYNFRCLFVSAFRRCARFNIRDFEPRYLVVPKQQFRYDSGIFILRFLQTFDGEEVQNFSNVDLLALRQKLLFQLLTFDGNKFKSKVIPLLS